MEAGINTKGLYSIDVAVHERQSKAIRDVEKIKRGSFIRNHTTRKDEGDAPKRHRPIDTEIQKYQCLVEYTSQ
jgi:hypothetical protein